MNLLQSKPPSNKSLQQSLSEEENQMILNQWKALHLGPFNEWCQISQSVPKYTYSQSFVCHMTLLLYNHKTIGSIGQGKNKKDAKKEAMWNMVVQIAELGILHWGLKKLKTWTIQESQKQQSAPKIQKLIKQSVLNGDFETACEGLCLVEQVKDQWEWNDVSFVWCMALEMKSLKHLKVIIDILQMREVANLELQQLNQAQEDFNLQECQAIDITQKAIQKMYGQTQRLDSQNPYDLVDYYNVIVNNPEIIEEEELAPNLETWFNPQEDKNFENISTQYQHQQQKSRKQSQDKFQIQLQENQNSQLEEIQQNQIIKTSQQDIQNYSDQQLIHFHQENEVCQKLTNMTNQVEIFKQPIFQQQPSDFFHGKNQIQEDQLIQNNFCFKQENLNDNQFSLQAQQPNPIIQIPQEQIQILSIDYPDQPQKKIKLDYQNQSNSNLFTGRQPKDPNIHYLPYNLLNEMYNVLLYIPDLSFCLQVAELLYTKIHLDDELFVNHQACLYYAHKKNILICESLEAILQIYQKKKLQENTINVQGKMEKIGEKQVQWVFEFNPIEPQELVQNKIGKKGGFLKNEEQYSMICEGEFIIIQPLNYHDQIIEPIIAKVQEIQKNFVLKLFILPNKQSSQILQDQNQIWIISKLFNGTSLEKSQDGLITFCTKICLSSPLMQLILTPPICNQAYVRSFSETKVAPIIQGGIMNNLNQSQNEALLAASSNLLTLIQGPPGTGKTTTAVEIILQWLRQSSSQVLACAESNLAVDILYNEFLKAGIRAVRIGHGLDERFLTFTDQRQRFHNFSFKNMDPQQAINARYGIIKKQLDQAEVICCTCIGSTSEYLKNYTFTRVLIDEATQTSEPSTIIPLLSNCQQLVLIGDHKQLPPTVLSLFAQSKGLTISLFERFVKQGVQPQWLTVQYRMHPSIAAFPNSAFYGNILTHNYMNDCIQFPFPRKDIRVLILDTKGKEIFINHSFYNEEEILAVEKVLKKCRGEQVSVITGYDAQKKRIEQRLKIEADTVDGYQGMERDFIIVSCVRSNRQRKLGFLKDPRRMCVALTRARKGLIVIGDCPTLMGDRCWRLFIQWGRDLGIVKNNFD